MTATTMTPKMPTITFRQKARQTLWGSRKRKAATLLTLLVLVPGSAVAAWLISATGQGDARSQVKSCLPDFPRGMKYREAARVLALRRGV